MDTHLTPAAKLRARDELAEATFDLLTVEWSLAGGTLPPTMDQEEARAGREAA